MSTLARSACFTAGQFFSQRTSVLPRVQVLRFVEIAVDDIRKVLEAGHREEVVAIAGLPDVNQIGELIAMIPEVARTDLNPSRRPMMGMKAMLNPA